MMKRLWPYYFSSQISHVLWTEAKTTAKYHHPFYCENSGITLRPFLLSFQPLTNCFSENRLTQFEVLLTTRENVPSLVSR